MSDAEQLVREMVVDGLRIEVERHADVGLLFATSPDYRGLLVAGATMETLEREIPRAISELRIVSQQYGKPFP